MSKNLINIKKLAVIGCSGLVGSSIVRCALEKGYEVNGTMRNIEDSTKINLKVFKMITLSLLLLVFLVTIKKDLVNFVI